MVKVVFVKAKGGSIGDWFTSLFNEGTGLCHCEFALPDGRRFGARPAGTRFNTSGFGAARETVLPTNLPICRRKRCCRGCRRKTAARVTTWASSASPCRCYVAQGIAGSARNSWRRRSAT